MFKSLLFSLIFFNLATLLLATQITRLELKYCTEGSCIEELANCNYDEGFKKLRIINLKFR